MPCAKLFALYAQLLRGHKKCVGHKTVYEIDPRSLWSSEKVALERKVLFYALFKK